MKVTGIIAEYNPFHKGHAYQIKTLRETHHPDYVVVAMSGDFLQRGTPALMDKYARTHMALLQGADLVFELPSYFSTSSAETFALGGILLFSTTGIINSLCFGAESNDLTRLTALARLLYQEPEWYRNALTSYLKEGMSFPQARSKALPEYADLLTTPNNILAIEYLKAIHTLAPSMSPILIPRKGSNYHDTDITGPLASASAIRQSLFQHMTAKDFHNSHIISPELALALPNHSYKIMEEYQQEKVFLQDNDFSLLLYQTLLKESLTSLLEYEDVTEALANRILKQRNCFLNWNDFCQKCNTKDSTHSRISRILAHLLLGIKKEGLTPYQKGHLHTLPYLRILGFRQSATPLLTELKNSATAPLITSPVQGDTLLSDYGLDMLKTDLYASDLYRSVLTNKTGHCYPNEFQKKLLIV